MDPLVDDLDSSDASRSAMDLTGRDPHVRHGSNLKPPKVLTMWRLVHQSSSSAVVPDFGGH